MNGYGSIFNPRMWLLAILLTGFVVACGKGGGDGASATGGVTAAGAGTGAGGAGRGPALVDLQTAGNFAILAQSAITDVPPSAVNGNVGLSPASGADIALTCAEVTGVMYSPDAAGPAPCAVVDAARLTIALADAVNAFYDADGRAPDYTELGAGNIGGRNLGPATYKWSTGLQIPANLTLTGGPNDVWIFQVAQGLSVSPDVHITLTGGALAQNVYWVTYAAADLGANSQFKGVVLSQTAIAMHAGASINGKLFAETQVALDRSTVSP